MDREITSVVVFPLPVIGHITPMLHFAARLVSQGLKVTFVTTRRSQSKVLRTMDEVLPGSATSSIELVAIPDGDGEENRASGIEAILEWIDRMAQLQGEFERLLEEVLDREPGRVACLVSDVLMGWSAQVAAKFRLPRAAFWTSSATFLLLMIRAEDFGDCLPLREETKNKLIPYIEGVPPLRTRELPYSIHHGNGSYFSALTRRSLEDTSWVIINTFDYLEESAIAALQKVIDQELVALGPLLPVPSSSPTAENDATGAILKWLDSKSNSSVLYISFGSVAGIESMKPIEELARGVEASGTDFLWVFRSNLVEDKQGEEQFLEQFQERIQASGRGLIVPWAPQLQVLQHSAVGGFLTHCGWNSILESLWSGVPMLGWPCMAEQNLNHKFLTDIWKVCVKFDAMDSASISSAVRKLMRGKEGREARKRAAGMKAASQGAAAPPEGTSHIALERFVELIKGESFRPF